MPKLDPAIVKLIELAFKAMKLAYCPYSNFPVGCAVLCADGTYFTGCNVENAAYPLGVCAEKTAACNAVSSGHRKLAAVAVCSQMKEHFITPCGSCRQFLSEFGMDMDIYMTKPDRSYVKMKARELLPLGFEPDRLNDERLSSSDVSPSHHGRQLSSSSGFGIPMDGTEECITGKVETVNGTGELTDGLTNGTVEGMTNGTQLTNGMNGTQELTNGTVEGMTTKGTPEFPKKAAGYRAPELEVFQA